MGASYSVWIPDKCCAFSGMTRNKSDANFQPRHPGRRPEIRLRELLDEANHSVSSVVAILNRYLPPQPRRVNHNHR